MSGADNNLAAVIAAITASRRAQARQYGLLRDMISRLVTREEFNDAMTSLSNALDAIDSDREAAAAHHAQQLAELLRRST